LLKPRIAIIGVGVRDFERAKRFYSDGLGWVGRSCKSRGVGLLSPSPMARRH
jgi:predicted enzyme related to lactoylglutathione lyase